MKHLQQNGSRLHAGQSKMASEPANIRPTSCRSSGYADPSCVCVDHCKFSDTWCGARSTDLDAENGIPAVANVCVKAKSRLKLLNCKRFATTSRCLRAVQARVAERHARFMSAAISVYGPVFSCEWSLRRRQSRHGRRKETSGCENTWLGQHSALVL